MGAFSVAGITANRKDFEPLLPDVRHIPAPDCHHCRFHTGESGCLMACAHELEGFIPFEDPNTVAAFIAEPIQAAGGVIVPPRISTMKSVHGIRPIRVLDRQQALSYTV